MALERQAARESGVADRGDDRLHGRDRTARREQLREAERVGAHAPGIRIGGERRQHELGLHDLRLRLTGDGLDAVERRDGPAE